MPKGRNCPGLPGLGMSFRLEGLGRYVPERNSRRMPSRNVCSPFLCRMRSTVIPSTPAERLPLLVETRRQACRIMRSSVSQPHRSRQVLGICLALLIEPALNVEYPSLIGLIIHVHRLLPRHADPPSSSCFPSPRARLSRALTTTKAPPSVSSIFCRATSPIPCRADDPSSRVPISNLCAVRR
jgi:hypothetical protein